MMTPLTPDEDRQALESLISGTRQEVARLTWMLRLHREILRSPAEQIAGIEAQAVTAVKAVEALEAWRSQAAVPAA